jgi:phosphoglycolate phosphatase-like HAD superfamily hydrolase
MSDPVQQLKDWKATKEFFIGIDSDGCVFDSMEIKQKECFAPMFIKHFGLQAVSKYARETWEFVNLYSKTRGSNRYKAIVRTFNLLADRKEVQARNVTVPAAEPVEEWMSRETKLGNPALDAEVARGNDKLKQVQAWSNAVNEQITDIVHGVPPFPLVRDCLEKMQELSDPMVISQTPVDALEREWKEHKIGGYLKQIAGAEMGTKTEHLAFAAKGKYADDKILMIGDAPGDRQAAKDNGALFFPINPGDEEASWQRLHDEGLEKFFSGSYAGEYEAGLIAAFDACLPEDPSW